VALSTYYDAKARVPSARALRDAVLGPALCQLWKDNYCVYGARKLWKTARRDGHDVGRDQVARLMRAEAEGDGQLGMLMVGNVGENRVIADCLDFKPIRTIRQMVFQSPGGFEAVQKSYFYQRAREQDIRLAQRAVNGERHHPASNALWFFRPAGECPPTWFNQTHSGRYKSHCFYIPDYAACPRVYSLGG